MVFYNFWTGFAAFAYSVFFFPTGSEWLEKKARYDLLRPLSQLCLVSSAYLFAIGAYLAVGWSNPFAGKGDEVAATVHGGKGAFVVLLLVVWPYFLMLAGAGSAFLGWKALGAAQMRRG